jgi:hypothetical protein
MLTVTKNHGFSYQACFFVSNYYCDIVFTYFSLFILFYFFVCSDCWEVLECCRVTFEKTIFSNLLDINSAEMNAVTWAIFKELNKVEENEFLDFFEVPQFFVTRLNESSLTRLVSNFFTCF